MFESKSAALFKGAGRATRAAGRQALRTGTALVEEVRRRRASQANGASGEAKPNVPEPDSRAQPKRAPDGVAVSGFPEPPGKDPGDISKDPSPHHALNNPVVDDPDPTEWPDPYDQRQDPRDPPDPDDAPFGEEAHPPSGSTSTSEPHPSQDPEAGDHWEGPKRDKLDD